ncbi:hypothetical protein [Bacillus cereus]|uniref:Uncharacterized protein n=1 Tax=Bacillus cereus TaxID=1396 RepID=A0A0G8F3J7_BACCE|nr:hypothetical protein [Bacillus cereus]KLA31091.1 hypothetical protein B4077_3359 [Bacillus cereus]
MYKGGKNYIQKNALKQNLNQVTHIVWGIEGSMVSKEVMEEYYQTDS